ncbi:MAG: hypothetical protein AAF334_10405, partial [Pseudomonadota bacterium]
MRTVAAEIGSAGRSYDILWTISVVTPPGTGADAVGAAVPVREIRSPNHTARRGTEWPDMVVLHYTGMECAVSAITRLCDPTAEVSAFHTGVVQDHHIRPFGAAPRRVIRRANLAHRDGG